MHWLLLVCVLTTAIFVRLSAALWPGKLNWQGALTLFALPPLLLISTCIAIVLMGCGRMFGYQAHLGSHLVAGGFLLWSVMWGFVLSWQAWQTQRQLSALPRVTRDGRSLHLLPANVPYCAQVGSWQPQLCASEGLFVLLNPTQLEAVFAHEEAHMFYRDTLIFFALGWLKRCTFFLPQTRSLWDELLWFRECRADQKAAEHCDPLVLAEALTLMVQPANFSAGSSSTFPLQVAFASHHPRLLIRIEALLTLPVPSAPPTVPYWLSFLQLAIAFIPLIFIPWHIKP